MPFFRALPEARVRPGGRHQRGIGVWSPVLGLLIALTLTILPQPSILAQAPGADSVRLQTEIHETGPVRYREGELLVAPELSLPGAPETWLQVGQVDAPTLRQAADYAVQRVEGLASELGARIERRIDLANGTPLVKLRLPEGLSPEEAARRLESQPGIRYAEPNYLWYPSQEAVFPDDTFFQAGYTWSLHNEGQVFLPSLGLSGTPDADIDMPEAWGAWDGTAGDPVIVAVIDTGTDLTHPDLTPVIWVNEAEMNGETGIDDDANGYVDDLHGWDFFNDDATVFDPDDGDDHGTHVASTIAAQANDGFGIPGIHWNVQVMALKFLGPDGGTTEDGIEAVNYAAANGAHLTNNSWGGGGYSEALKEAIEASGVLFFAAAGNDGVDTDAGPHYPSSYDSPNIVSVAASDWNDDLAYFSNYGAETVDLAAPGFYTFAAVPGGWAWYGGTSMATPHVAGVGALLLSRYPDLPAYPGAPGTGTLSVKEILMYSAEYQASYEGKMQFPGRLNAYRALEQILPPVVTALEVTPTHGAGPLEITFTVDAFDPDGSITASQWDFGDGVIEPGVLGALSHTYTAPGGYVATLTLTDDEGYQTVRQLQISVVTDDATLVLVDDDPADAEEALAAALDAKGYDYITLTTDVPLPPAIDNPILWTTGTETEGTIMPEDEAFLAAYTSRGGRLLLSSPGLLNDLGVDAFVEDVLRVRDGTPDVGATTLSGVAGDPISDGMTTSLDPPSTETDALEPSPEAYPLFTNENGDVVAVRYVDTTYRSIFLAFPFEALPAPAGEVTVTASEGEVSAAELLAAAIGYLTGDVNYPPEIGPAGASPQIGQESVTTTLSAPVNDPDGNLVRAWWSFGDGSADGEGLVVKHTYTWTGPERLDSYVATFHALDDQGHERRAEVVVYVTGPGVDTVFINDVGEPDVSGDAEELLTQAGLEHVSLPAEEVVQGFETGARLMSGLGSYFLVWSTGEVGSLDEDERAALAGFLDKGGRLLLSGQDLLYVLEGGNDGPIDNSFAREYLHVASVQHDVGFLLEPTVLHGVEGDPVSGEVEPFELAFPEEMQNFADAIVPRAEATAFLLMDARPLDLWMQPTAIRYDGGPYRLAFFAIPIEALPRASEEPVPEAMIGTEAFVPPSVGALLIRRVYEEVYGAPVVTLTAPETGTTVAASDLSIRWHATDTDGSDAALRITLEFSKDGGATWERLAEDLPNTGSYPWELPEASNTPQAHLRIMATDVDGKTATDEVGPFTLVRVASLITHGPNPAGNEATFYYGGDQPATLHVYDPAGRPVFQASLGPDDPQRAWDLRNSRGEPLASGLYLYLVVLDDGTRSPVQRLVIER